MTDEDMAKAEWVFPLAKVIRDAALAENATPTDRLAGAVLLLAREIIDFGQIMSHPVIIKEQKNAP